MYRQAYDNGRSRLGKDDEEEGLFLVAAID
jgi:hypothetical protein